MRNKVYFDVFTTPTHIEYHTSADEIEVRNRASMNRRIAIDNPEAGQRVVAWFNDADMYDCIRIHTQPKSV